MSDPGAMEAGGAAPKITMLGDEFGIAEDFTSGQMAVLMSAARAADTMIICGADFETGRPCCVAGPTRLALGRSPAELLADPQGVMALLGRSGAEDYAALREELRQKNRVVRNVRLKARDGTISHWRKMIMRAGAMGREYLLCTLMNPDSMDGLQLDTGFRVAVEQAHQGLALTDVNGCYSYLNQEHARLFGYDSPAELIGRSWQVLYTAEGLAHVEKTVFPLLAKQGYWHGRVMAKRKDGSLFHEELTLSLLPGGGIVCNCRDCSEEVRMAEQARNREALFRQFMDAVPFGVIIREIDGAITYANEAVVKFTGIGRDRLVGVAQMKFLGDEFLANSRKFDALVVEGGKPHTYDAKIDWGGKEWMLSITKLVLSFGQDRPTHICSLVEDVTARRRMESAERQTSQRRQEFIEMQREFISLVSHEFRTPLTAIQGTHYLLKKKLETCTDPVKAEFQRFLDLQERALNTLKAQVDQVLLLNRIEHMTTEKPPQPVEVRLVLERVVEVFNGTIPKPRVQLTSEVPLGWTALVHESLLRAAVENLVSNGMKYSPDDQPVEVALVATGEGWKLSVKDHGRGIPLADQAKLFQPFFRAGNVGNVPGTGLGLTIVQRVAEFHQGYVEFKTAPQAGTCFTMVFPPRGWGAKAAL